MRFSVRSRPAPASSMALNGSSRSGGVSVRHLLRVHSSSKNVKILSNSEGSDKQTSRLESGTNALLDAIFPGEMTVRAGLSRFQAIHLSTGHAGSTQFQSPWGEHASQGGRRVYFGQPIPARGRLSWAREVDITLDVQAVKEAAAAAQYLWGNQSWLQPALAGFFARSISCEGRSAFTRV